MMRMLAGIALALLVVVTTSSAYVRLAQTGLSCPDAPHCYARVETRAALEDDARVAAARSLHRVAASAAGFVLLAILALGWRGARRDERVAAIALVGLAAALAWLGRYTPSDVPAVALGNLLGGMTMLGLAGWLFVSARGSPRATGVSGLRRWAWLALVLVALQIAAGGMMAVRHAAFACPTFPDCSGTWWPEAAQWSAFDPFRPMPAPTDAGERADAARQAVSLAHRGLGLIVVFVVAALGLRTARAGWRRTGAALFALALVQAALGIGQVLTGQPLGLAVAHNFVAAGLVLALAAVLRPRGSATP
jgi:cytochrome c oxidase assembly protein subunit 15